MSSLLRAVPLMVVAVCLGSCIPSLHQADVEEFLQDGLHKNLHYDGNGNTNGSAPGSVNYRLATIAVVAAPGNLAKSGYAFSCWNTAADGSGASFSPGDAFAMPVADVTLYVQWVDTIAGYKVVDASNLATAIASDLDGSFLLTEDVDTRGDGDWTPIGNQATPFTGTLDGGGHTITFKNGTGSQFIGLFGAIDSGGTVRNVKLDGNVKGNICTGSVTGLNKGTISGCTSSMALIADGYNSTGGIAGENYGTIEYCSFTGTITQATTGMVTDMGCIVGRGWGGRIYRCYSTGTITASTTNSHFVGGIIGAANMSGGGVEIQECYASGAITGYRYVGGLVGCMNAGSIKDCYTRGNVNGNVCVGGLIGGNNSNPISNSYATGNVTWISDGGFLIGLIGTAPTQSYVAKSGVAYYLATLGNAIPAGWDTGIWTRNAAINGGYPYLPNTHTP